MDFGWLAVVGILLLLAGLSALGFDTLRQRRRKKPYDFPEIETTLLDFPTGSPKSVGAVREPPVHSPKSPWSRLWTMYGRFANRPYGPWTGAKRRGLWTAPKGPDRSTLYVLGAVCCSLLLVAAGVAALVSRSEPEAPVGRGLVIALAPFANAPGGDPTSRSGGDLVAPRLSQDIAQAAGASGLQIVFRTARSSADGGSGAESERARLKADVLVAGEYGADGGITASLALGPGVNSGYQPWQQWSERNPSVLLLPRQAHIRLPAAVGTAPLVPLALALAYLKAGEYEMAANAAHGGQAAVDDSRGSGQVARFVEATSLAASGDARRALEVLGEIERNQELPPEALVNRAAVRLRLADYTGARADLDRVLRDRDTAGPAVAIAHLLRGRAIYGQVGDASAALADLDQALQLEPSLLAARLARAEIFYRNSQPDQARAELEAILKVSPGAASARTQLALVWLMLGKPDEAQKQIDQVAGLYSGWVAALRADEAKAQMSGDGVRAQSAAAGIQLLNRELASIYLYRGMALADQASKEPAESFLGGLWRRVRGQPTTYQRALAAVQDAYNLDKRRPDILLQMGAVYSRLGDTARAAEVLQQAQEMAPASPEPYMALAQLQESQGNQGEAAKTLNSLIEHSPDYYPAYRQLYDLYTRASDAKSASAALGRGLRVPAHTPSDHLWHGKFLRLLGRNPEAATELRAASQAPNADPSLVEAHLLLGQVLLESGQRPEALAEFQAVLSTQPNEPTALLYAGRLLAQAGQAREAESLFSRLTSLKPDSVEGHIAYSELLTGKGELDQAVAEAQKATQAGPERADAHFHLGLAYEARRDWSDASGEYRTTLARDPAHFEALIRLAVSLFRDDRYSESVTTADAAVKARSDDPQAYRWKAEDLLALREPDAALQSLKQASEISPRSADLMALTARAYLMKGHEASAMAYAVKAASIEPRNPVGQLAMGAIYLARGQTAEALPAFQEAASIAPSSPDAIIGQAQAHSGQGDKQKALKLLSDALALDGRDAEAHLWAGHVYVDLNRWDDALREYDTAARLRPRWPDALYYLGRAYVQHKDLPKAHQAFSEAVKNSPNLVEAWIGLGITARDLGQGQEAITALSRATRLDKNRADAWLNLGLAYEQSAEIQRAADAYRQALNTTTDPAIREQAEQGLKRAK